MRKRRVESTVAMRLRKPNMLAGSANFFIYFFLWQGSPPYVKQLLQVRTLSCVCLYVGACLCTFAHVRMRIYIGVCV